MRNISVCLSPELLPLCELSGKQVIVVDILRATSCIVTAFANNISELKVFDAENECRSQRDYGYKLAGERGGIKLDGFDLGNSPFDYLKPENKNAKIAMTTTNGTKALRGSESAKLVYVGAFLNFSATVKKVVDNSLDTLIVCSGWKGHVNSEDTLYAGMIIDKLLESKEYEVSDDASVLALNHYLINQEDIRKVIQNSAHAKRLLKLTDIKGDLDFCSQIDTYNWVPICKNGIVTI